jgi:hypothetical protein
MAQERSTLGDIIGVALGCLVCYLWLQYKGSLGWGFFVIMIISFGIGQALAAFITVTFFKPDENVENVVNIPSTQDIPSTSYYCENCKITYDASEPACPTCGKGSYNNQ